MPATSGSLIRPVTPTNGGFARLFVPIPATTYFSNFSLFKCVAIVVACGVTWCATSLFIPFLITAM